MDYVIIDTSSILFGFSNKIDVFESVLDAFHGKKIMISSGVLRELRSLSTNRGKKGANARAALAAIKVKNVKVEDILGNVDRWILSSAPSFAAAVITNDTQLAKSLKAKGVKVLKISRDGSLR